MTVQFFFLILCGKLDKLQLQEARKGFVIMFPDSDIVHIISFQVLKSKNSVFVLE